MDQGYYSGHYVSIILLEECPSGRWSTLGKRVNVKAFRGFESHLLRNYRTNDPVDRLGWIRSEVNAARAGQIKEPHLL